MFKYTFSFCINFLLHIEKEYIIFKILNCQSMEPNLLRQRQLEAICWLKAICCFLRRHIFFYCGGTNFGHIIMSPQNLLLFLMASSLSVCDTYFSHANQKQRKGKKFNKIIISTYMEEKKKSIK